MHRFLIAFALVLTVALAAPAFVRAQEASPPASPAAGIVESIVNVDGRAIHLACAGSGSPTVLFEPGGPISDGGTAVVSDVGSFVAAALGTRFCSYDRAGSGQSDPDPVGVRTFTEAAADLNAVLASPELDCPCVVIGESLGGSIALVAVAEDTMNVAGLVLLDPPYPGYFDKFLALAPPDSSDVGPDALRYFGGENEEQLDVASGFRQVTAQAAPLEIPVIVVTHGAGDPPPCFPCSADYPVTELEAIWQSGQAELARALGGRLVVAEDTSHFITEENPDLVLALASEVIAAVRDPSTWTPSEATLTTQTSPMPPTQPATGPGGMDYAYDRVVFTEHGEAAGGYLLFEPADPRGGGTPVATAPLPIVLFLSACCEAEDLNDVNDNGAPWLDWIDHLTRRGAVVVFPRFDPHDPMTGVITAVKSAMADLKGSGHPPTDPTRFVAVGHSFGAMLAVQYAASAADQGLPVPIALMPTAPGWGNLPRVLENTAAVPATTRLLVLVAEDDYQAMALEIWARLDQIPADRKDFVVVQSDSHGAPPLIADHGIPATDVFGTLDALDWFGIWKWADALIACSIDGTWCEYALGNTPEQRFLGTWSDGVPVREPLVTDDPRIGAPVEATPSS